MQDSKVGGRGCLLAKKDRAKQKLESEVRVFTGTPMLRIQVTGLRI